MADVVDMQGAGAGAEACPGLPPASLSDRSLAAWHCFTAGPRIEGREELGLTALSGNGTLQQVDRCIEAKYEGLESSYQLRFRLREWVLSNGVSARFRLRGWDGIRYVAIGYTHENAFRHVKIANVARDTWVETSAGHGDIAWGLQNNWNHPLAVKLADIRLYVRGTPGAGGGIIEVEHLSCWREAIPKPENFWGKKLSEEAVSHDVVAALQSYLKDCVPEFEGQARRYLDEGCCPLLGGVCLPWPQDRALPDGLDEVGTYRFSWHALHPAIILALHGRCCREPRSIAAAREFVAVWLERSYFGHDPDTKYAWYDHGAAERCLAFLLMWIVGLEERFEPRFMGRLREAIFRHGQLLASEAFYALHQPTRYHNHAWFQDLGLLATTLVFPHWPCAQQWQAIALGRLADQFQNLIVRDNGLAVFVENSIGYQNKIAHLTEFAGQLVALSQGTSEIAGISASLVEFLSLLRYDDGRTPAQGDTFRRPNSAKPLSVGRGVSARPPNCLILPKAGYAIAKGRHADTPYTLCVFATSLSSTHKHEDNLSFTLFFDGLEWLIDPSFHSHAYTDPIPTYLRSAVAHNAVAFPGRKYSIAPGLATLSGSVDGAAYHLAGEHRAYQDVVVSRSIEGRLDRLSLHFCDQVTCSAAEAENVRLMLHCGEGVDAIVRHSEVILSHPNSCYQVVVRLPANRLPPGVAQVASGRTDDPSQIKGVTGHGFMQVAAINTIECAVPVGEELRWNIEAQICAYSRSSGTGTDIHQPAHARS